MIRKKFRIFFLRWILQTAVPQEAVSCGADMIITHHPMIFSGLKKINTHDFTGRKVIRLIQEDIPYYAMHTNYDILGMADLSAEGIGISQTSVLSVTEDGLDGHTGIWKSRQSSRRDEPWRIRRFCQNIFKAEGCESVRRSKHACKEGLLFAQDPEKA